jgi:predicted dehydrogenase
MPDPLKIALIGAGHMGRYHARALAERDDVKLVTVCDVDRRRAEDVAGIAGARAETDISLLAGPFDAAVVSCDTSAHEEVSVPLLQRGVGLLVEKPLAATVREARAIVETADRAGALCHTGHIVRFTPVTRAVEGRPFTPERIEAVWRSPFTGRSTDVSVVLDLMIHGIDLALAWTGEMPETVEARGETVEGPHADAARAELRFPGGCVASLVASRVSETRERRVGVFGRGDVEVELDYAAGTARWNGEDLPVETGADALRVQLGAFLAAVRGDGDAGVGAEEGARAVEVATRIEACIAGA